MNAKLSLNIAAYFLLVNSPIYAAPIVPADPSSHCAVLMSPGRLAVRTASHEIKTALLKSWSITFNSFNISWAPLAADIIQELGPEIVDAKAYARKAIHDLFASAPYQVENLPRLAGPRNQSRVLNILRPKFNFSSEFTRKYEIETYVEVSKRIFSDLLPKVYSERGIYFGDSETKFNWLALKSAFRIADQFELEKEKEIIFYMMLIHNRFDDAGDAAAAAGSDELIYKAGLYALSTFFWNSTAPFYYNNLWSAIEIFKRLQGDDWRRKANDLLVDLAEEIMSPRFYRTVVSAVGAEEAQSRYPIYYTNLIRGLRSGGQIIVLHREDSVKVDVITKVSDFRTETAIRKLLSLLPERDYNEVELQALQSINAKVELRGRADGLFRERLFDAAARYYAAAGDLAKSAQSLARHFDALALKRTTAFDYGYALRKLFEVAAGNGQIGILKADLVELLPAQAELIESTYAEQARDFMKPNERYRDFNRVDSEYAQFEHEYTRNSQSLVTREKGGALALPPDDFQRGFVLLRQAFLNYRNSQ